MHGTREEGGLADPVAVGARASALRGVDDEVAAAAANQVDDARAAPLRPFERRPGARASSVRRCRSSRRGGTRDGQARRRPERRAVGLSASRTDRNAVPAVGSGRPAARSAFANAVGRSAALAITSPVERISGPSTGSLPGKRANGKHGRLHATCAHGRSRAEGRARERAPAASRQAAATRLIPIALLANGTVRDARGFASSTNRSRVGDRELHVQQADDAEPQAVRAGGRSRATRSRARR